MTLVLHNSERDVAGCLDSLRAELDDQFAELIAVDNASPDQSARILKETIPDARLVHNDQNRGFAAGANSGWPFARGRFWMLLNPDVRLQPGGLGELVAWMERHPAIGLASPELRDAEGGGPARTGRAVPSPWLPLLEATRVHRLLPRRARGRLLRGSYWTGGDQTDAGWVPATAAIVRREVVEAAGLLDERFFLYGEDIEWCWRIRRAGWSIGVCSAVRARHHEGSSVERTFGDPARRASMARGEVEAVRIARGPRYARLYAAATALALGIESLHPRRQPDRRKACRSAAQDWRAAARAVGSRP